MTTTIHFHAGISTSGGTIIEICHDTHRILFDFGFVFAPETHVFDGTIAAGGPFYLRDLCDLGLLPPVDGVFPADRLDGTDVRPAGTEGLETMVLVSHPHEDHVGAIGLIDPQVPVVMSDEGARLVRTLAALGQFDLPRSVRGLPFGDELAFGPFRIKARYSDHPAWGSVGFEIGTPDGRMFWTGDFRLHGRGRERAMRELKALREVGIAVLFTEGTTLGSALPVDPSPEPCPPGALVMADGLATEEGVDAHLAEAISSAGPVFLNVYNRDFSPLQNVLRLAVSAGRRVAVQPDIAVILERLTGELLPVYVGRGEPLTGVPAVVRDLLTRTTLVTTDDVLSQPGNWVVQLGYAQTLEVLPFRGLGGIYLHIGGTPLGGGTPELRRLRSVLENTATSYSQAGRHVHFAHPTPGHIALLAQTIDPTYVAVVHAPYPEEFVPPTGTRIAIAPGVTLLLDDGVLRSKE